MEALQAILAKLNGSGITFDDMTPKDFEQMKVDSLNASEGSRHLEDGYNCKACKNKGYIVKLQESPGGHFTQVMADCKCADIRRSILRMKKSGLKDVIKDFTFDKYEATEPWQNTIKSAAKAYSEHPNGWFYIGGQSGAGKSMICTAICREFLLNGRRVMYMSWREDVAVLKGLAMEPEEREKLINRFKQTEVLYIDDLFKDGKGEDGKRKLPSPADIRLAFEIINYRYNNPNLLTLLSSEWSVDELLGIDEAIGGRIFERAGANGFNIAPDRSKNYRTKKMVTL